MRALLALFLAACLVAPTPLALADDGFPTPVPAEDPPTGGPTDAEAPASTGWPGVATPTQVAPRATVPHVVGLSMVDAQKRLAALGFQPRPWFVDVAGTEPFQVVNQKVAAGTRVASGTTVDFRVARAAVRTDRVPVPHLLGLTRDETVVILRALGVEGMMLSRRPGEFRGRVVRQDPEPGAWMQGSQFLSFTLSGEGQDVSPPAPVVTEGVAVGPVIGLQVVDAQRAAQSAGIRPHVVRRLDSDAQPGYVAEQDPQPGQRAAPGTVLTLYVPQESLVPELRGLTLEQAEIALSAASLRSRFDPRPSGSEAKGVSAQRPAAGNRVAAGSVVALLFEGDAASGGPAWRSAEAPFGAIVDVMGVAPGEAQLRLKASGFESVLEWAPGAARDGDVRVAGQSFPPGARRRMGTTVVLWVDVAAPVPAQPLGEDDPGLLEKVGGFFRRIPGEVSKLPGEAKKIPGALGRLGEEVKKLPGKVEDLVK